MAPLGNGIRLNQDAPKGRRASRRILHALWVLAAILALVFIVVWGRASQAKAAQAERAAATTKNAAPATSALSDIDNDLKDQPPPTVTPVNTPSLNPCPPFCAPPSPPVVMQQHRKTRAEIAAEEERAAMDSPLVPTNSSQSSQQQLPRGGIAGAHAAGEEPGDGSAAEDTGHENEYLAQNLQRSKKEFAGVDKDTTSPIVVGSQGGLPPCMIRAGWDIPAILESINSSLPGEIRARVRENVYDSDTGRCLVIPQNSLLVGHYNADVAYAQRRVQVSWDRLERPHVPTIFLGKMNGVDALGNAGLGGDVDNHLKRIIGYALLSSAFAAGIEISQERNYSTYGYPSAGQMAGAAVGQNMGQFGQKVTEKNMNIPPTIKVPVGTLFNVRADRDVIFVAPYNNQ